MQTILNIILRIVIVYVYILLVVRLSGKRTVAEGTPFDFVVALIIANLPGDIVWGDVPLARGIVAISTIMLVHLAVVVSAYHIPLVHRLVDSTPSVLLKHGRKDKKNLAFERVNDKELDELLREQKIHAHNQVASAMLEPSGTLSVQRTPSSKLADHRDLDQLPKS
jgi:uncharacterized membrane protein YcaP (DUF421 family)